MSGSELARVKAPISTRDFAFFYDGLKRGLYLVQRCARCRRRRHPASPICPFCQNFEWDVEPIGPLGTVHSYVIHHHPKMPDYASPHAVVLVDMAQDVRVTGALVDWDADDIRVGMAVSMEFADHGNGFTLHRFRPVAKNG
jgi:uncharacterized protein